MTPLFRKLNLGAAREILLLDAPEEFEPEVAALSGVEVRRDVGAAERLEFLLAFVRTLDGVARVAREVLPKAEGDAVVWLAYPKGSSKRYACEFNRDNGWEAVGAAGFEPVRQVAIDEDWSALRFRRPAFIRSMKRDASRAASPEGRARLSGDGA